MTDAEKKPTVAVVGDEQTVGAVTDALSDEDLRVETVDADDMRGFGDAPDCVVTDSLALLERIGESDMDVPAVFVSDGSTEVSEAVEWGATEYIELPLDDTDRTMFRRRVRRYAEATHKRAKHAERKEGLREAQLMYEAFVDDPNILVGVLDTDGTLIYPNPKSLEYIEAEPSQVVGKPFWDTPWCDSKTKEQMMENIRRAAEGEVVEYNAEHLEEGTENYITSGFVRPVTDESGDVRSVIVSSRDITERVESERELRRSREEYEQLINSMNETAWIIDLDGNYLDVNDTAVEKLGYSRDELLSISPYEIDAGLEEDEIEDLITSMPEDEAQVFETVHKTKDGEEIPVEISSSLVSFEGEEAILSIARDISHRKEYERELERSRDMLRQTERIAKVGGWEADLRTGEIRWTDGAREIHDVPEDFEPTAENYLDLYHPDDRPRLRKLNENLGDEEMSLDEEFRILTDDGVRWVRSTGTPVVEDGEVVKLRGAIRDITERKRRERELKRSRELLRQTERISDTGGWEVDLETGEQRWTHGTRKIHGVEEDYEPTIEEGIEFYHPDDRDEIREAVRRCRENGEPYDKELRLITADDELRWVRSRGEPVEEEGGVVALRGAIQDITERKRYERELERYESLWKNLPIGICRVRADDGGAFLRVNDRLVEMTGAESEDELLRLSTDDFWTDEHEREEVLELVKENGWVTTEHRFQALDGGFVWARVTAIGHETKDGMVLDGVVQDITDRRQREEQLETAEEIADMGSWYKNIPSDLIHWSDRVYDLWGIDGEGPIDHDTFLEYVHPDDEEYVDRKWQEAKEGEPYDIEHRILRGDGELRWMRETAEITFEDGEPVGATGIVQDITERKQREEALERRKEQVEFFNGLLRHEMLNSMTVITGSSRTALDRLSEEHDAYEDVRRIYDRSEKVVELINRVRSVLRRISGEGRVLKQRDIVEVVEDRASSLRDRCDLDVDVEVDVPDEAYVEADEFLDDVVDNILDNAVEHNDKEVPRVDISVEKDDAVVLRVADNGPGVPDERKDEIFRQGVTGKTGGTLGFGLYFVDSMVSEYGGDVYVEDNEPEGAVFVVELPKDRGNSQEVDG